MTNHKTGAAPWLIAIAHQTAVENVLILMAMAINTLIFAGCVIAWRDALGPNPAVRWLYYNTLYSIV